MLNLQLNKIMLIEDEPDIAAIAKFALEKYGQFIVKYCSSGREALNQVSGFAPDLILLDVMMPGMDGMATLVEMRKLPALKDIPVVFITAKTQMNAINRYKELGIAAIITKPFRAKNLSNDLHEIWKKYKENITVE